MTTDTGSPPTATVMDNHFGGRFQIVVVLIAIAAVLLLVLQSDAGLGPVLAVASGYALGISLVVAAWLLAQFIWLRVQQKRQTSGQTPDNPMAWYRAYLATIRWGDIFAALLALIVTVSCFTVYKSTVVGAEGYGFDAMFIAWDRALFGGQDPWVLSHAVFPTPFLTKIIDFIYHPAFLPMVLGYTVCIAAQGRPALRYTYMVSYLASFVIIGMVMASAMHSAGPVYDGVLFGDGTTFAPLIERLAAQSAAAGPFSAVFAQDYLLRLNELGVTGLGGGISAMPSMHIVLAFLWVLPAWHLNRVLGAIVTVYALIIWIGSVHLGWHYFVDGLVGVAVLGPIWYASGRAFGLYGKA
ncbi:phosphatase PAP2 family protein [Loktanella sp. 5RATIMAR09]|uniref:phosphatase PAP2 family protein n=1 Tax=Loktanella sp. 5RATIMAR09 TaxID=1225655 RepID=UPI0006EBC88A|nr:phosphatase PAP2 family protein [Loktanella sp. 5RATIMAR09]